MKPQDIRVFNKILNRKPNTNKYDYGHVLVIGGAPGTVGAPLLAGEAAMRSGAGLVTIASKAGVIDKLERRVKEVMTLRLSFKSIQPLLDFIKQRKVSVVVIGPGLSRAEPNKRFVRKFAGINRLPLVIDADALFALSGHLKELKAAAARNLNLVLTPHAGEYKRLSRGEPAEFAKQYRVNLVLKGPNSKVFHPDGSIYKNPTGNPGLATAGTGDVLAGIIGALLAQGLSAANAAELGVYLHALAGRLAADSQTQTGMIASDVIGHIPVALKKIASLR